MLGLMGLLLAFTFSLAVTRYETRRDLVLQEANAIGTAWLRAGLLSDPARDEVRVLLQRYVDLRLEYVPLGQDEARLREGEKQCAAIESALWAVVESTVRPAPNDANALFVESVNALVDLDSARLTATRSRIPEGVWVLLVVVACFGCFTSSYASGAEGARSGFTSVALPALITIVIGLIFDLTHPQQGVIGISQQPLHEVKEMMQRPL
jgi:hypothetical protein